MFYHSSVDKCNNRENDACDVWNGQLENNFVFQHLNNKCDAFSFQCPYFSLGAMDQDCSSAEFRFGLFIFWRYPSGSFYYLMV